LIDVIII